MAYGYLQKWSLSLGRVMCAKAKPIMGPYEVLQYKEEIASSRDRQYSIVYFSGRFLAINGHKSGAFCPALETPSYRVLLLGKRIYME